MILARLSALLQQRQRVSLKDLAENLHAAPEALRAMLARLEGKGRVRRLPAGTACRGCCQCDPALIELYEWVGSDPAQALRPIRLFPAPAAPDWHACPSVVPGD